MAEKCPKCPPQGAPEWMVTYGDLMTLLLCFFVLLFSFSEIDKVNFQSLKDSFTGAFGPMDGHSIMEGKGVTSQPQRYTTVLFDNAVEKTKKAQSDKFPHEQLDYLNSSVEEAQKAVGMLLDEGRKNGVAVDHLEQLFATIREKQKDNNRKKAREKEESPFEMENRNEPVEPRAKPSEADKIRRMKKESTSDVQGMDPLNRDQTEKNLEENEQNELILARGDQFRQRKGDSSRSQKNQGRNLPMIGNPGENQQEEGMTGQNLIHHNRMDRVEGHKDKKRFDFAIPKKQVSDSKSLNVAGQVQFTQSDANTAIISISRKIMAEMIFYPKSDRFRPGYEKYLRPLLEDIRGIQEGYFQVEAHTDRREPGSDYGSNDYLSARMAIALIQKLMQMDQDLSPSQFAAVGWGDKRPLAELQDLDSPLHARIEISWVKRGKP